VTEGYLAANVRREVVLAMKVTIEIPEDRAARFLKQAQARGLTLDR